MPFKVTYREGNRQRFCLQTGKLSVLGRHSAALLQLSSTMWLAASAQRKESLRLQHLPGVNLPPPPPILWP